MGLLSLWFLGLLNNSYHYPPQAKNYKLDLLSLRHCHIRGKRLLHVSLLREKNSGTTSFSWLCAVERWAPNAQIKVSLSWQTLEDFTLTVSLCVNQIQPQHIVKQRHVSLKDFYQNKMSFHYGTLWKRKGWTGTITLSVVKLTSVCRCPNSETCSTAMPDMCNWTLMLNCIIFHRIFFKISTTNPLPPY